MKLLPLFPRGLGTRDVESLGSFLMRCAIAHRMSTPEFAATLVSNFTDRQDPESQPTAQSHNGGRISSQTTLTWPDGWASRLASLLNSIYETKAFTSLGLLRLYPGFRHFPRVFVTGFRWCPVCWQQDMLRRQEPYFRVIWSLYEYSTCETHDCRLIDSCPRCGARVTHGLRGGVCNCSKCGSSLLEDEAIVWRAPIDHSYRDVIDVVEFIQLNPRWCLEGNNTHTLLPQFIIDSMVDDKYKWTARSLLEKYQEKPTFTKLRRLCWFFRLDLWRVLSSRNKQLPLLKLDPGCAKFPPGIEVRTKVRPPGNDQLISHLKRLLHANTDCPKPAKFYANAVGISPSGFQHRYPDLYNRIVSFYEFYKRSERAKLKMQIEMVLALMKDEGSFSRGVKKICNELMSEWGFPKNISRQKIKEFRDSL